MSVTSAFTRVAMGPSAGLVALTLSAAAFAGPRAETTAPLHLEPATADDDDDDGEAVSTTRTTAFVAEPLPGAPEVGERRAGRHGRAFGGHFSVAPLFGWGTNQLGVSAGGRAGYRFAIPVYLGASVLYHQGFQGSRSTGDASIELGYDIDVRVAPLVARPYFGSGVLVTTDSGPTSTMGLFYPGFSLLYVIPRSNAFVGADAKLLIPLQHTVGVEVAATTGLDF